MKIVVTGGAGYIGSVLVPMLLEKGYRVHVVDSFRYGNEMSLAGHLHNSNLTIERADVRSWDGYRRFDAVIPLAAIVGAPACDRMVTEAIEINVGTVRSMMAAIVPGQMVVYPNTNSAYGSNPGTCDEDAPLNPKSLYARSKQEGENVVRDRFGISLRLATVFGMSPRMRLDLMVNDFMYRALRDRSLTLFDPKHRRNFIHVRGVARAFIFALNNYEAMKSQAFNVGQDSANMTKEDLCRFIRTHVPGFQWHIAEGQTDPDQRDYEVSSAKIRALGYDPLYSLDDGIHELMQGLAILPGTILGNV